VPKCLSGVIRAAATLKVEWSTSGCSLYLKSDELVFRRSAMRRELLPATLSPYSRDSPTK